MQGRQQANNDIRLEGTPAAMDLVVSSAWLPATVHGSFQLLLKSLKNFMEGLGGCWSLWRHSWRHASYCTSTTCTSVAAGRMVCTGRDPARWPGRRGRGPAEGGSTRLRAGSHDGVQIQGGCAWRLQQGRGGVHGVPGQRAGWIRHGGRADKEGSSHVGVQIQGKGAKVGSCCIYVLLHRLAFLEAWDG